MHYQGKKHRDKAEVSSRLTCSLLLGTDCPGFINALTNLGDARRIGKCGRCAVLADDARSPDAFPGGVDPTEYPLGVRIAFDQVIKMKLVRPDTVVTVPHLAIISDRLYRVSHDTHSGEATGKLFFSGLITARWRFTGVNSFRGVIGHANGLWPDSIGRAFT